MKKLVAMLAAVLALAACGNQEASVEDSTKAVAATPVQTYNHLSIDPEQKVVAVLLKIQAPPTSFPRFADKTIGDAYYHPEEKIWRVIVISWEQVGCETLPLRGRILEVDGMTSVEVVEACDSDAREIYGAVVRLED